MGRALFKRLAALTIAVLPWTAFSLLAPLWWVFENMSEFALPLLATDVLLLLVWAVPLAFRRVSPREAALPVVFLLAATAVHFVFLSPLWFGAADPGPLRGEPLRVMAMNVHTANRDFDSVLGLVRAEKPHVIFLLEVDSKWVEALEALEEEYPFRCFFPSDRGNFGIGVLSRVEGSVPAVLDLRSDQPRMPSMVRVRFTWDGFEIEAVGVHTLPPVSFSYARANRIQLEALAEYVRASGHPCILAGDFNHTPWSHTFRRLLRDGGLSHGREGRGYLSTWPRRVPFMRIPIDHVLASAGLAITSFRCFPAGGSDHNPIQAELRFTAGADAR